MTRILSIVQPATRSDGRSCGPRSGASIVEEGSQATPGCCSRCSRAARHRLVLIRTERPLRSRWAVVSFRRLTGAVLQQPGAAPAAQGHLVPCAAVAGSSLAVAPPSRPAVSPAAAAHGRAADAAAWRSAVKDAEAHSGTGRRQRARGEDRRAASQPAPAAGPSRPSSGYRRASPHSTAEQYRQ